MAEKGREEEGREKEKGKGGVGNWKGWTRHC